MFIFKLSVQKDEKANMFNFVIYNGMTVLCVSAIHQNRKHQCKELCDDMPYMKYIRVRVCSEVSPVGERSIKILNVYVLFSR